MNTKRLALWCLILCAFSARGAAQTEQKEGDKEREQRDKIEAILRIQDTRTIHDGKLVSFFDDRDPVVRARAALAYGSIGDTSAIPILVDHLSSDKANVQLAAAFAIGQTAAQLSKRSRERLEHELIWTRIDQMNGDGDSSAADRLIEEI